MIWTQRHIFSFIMTQILLSNTNTYEYLDNLGTEQDMTSPGNQKRDRHPSSTWFLTMVHWTAKIDTVA